MFMLETLETRRCKWTDVYLYASDEDAIKDGYEYLYTDDEGSVYGIRNEKMEGRWKKIAFVPLEPFKQKYDNLAYFEPVKYKGYTIYRREDSKWYSVVEEYDWLSGEDLVLTTRKTLESCKRYADEHPGFFYCEDDSDRDGNSDV